MVDAVLTDPPYGIKMSEGFGGFGGFGKPIARRKYTDKWDAERPTKETFDLILGAAETVLIFGGNFCLTKLSRVFPMFFSSFLAGITAVH